MNLNFVFRLLLAFNATSLLLVIYQVKKPVIFLGGPSWLTFLLSACLILVPIALTKVSILLSRKLEKTSFKAGSISSIEHANNSFLPSYLGYFFVALSIPNVETLVFVYVVLYVFTFLSQALYFNPLFLLFGYRFYNIVTTEGTAAFLISKEDFRKPADIEISVANRINGYTFLEGN